jgi:hypothetical protein
MPMPLFAIFLPRRRAAPAPRLALMLTPYYFRRRFRHFRLLPIFAHFRH